MVVWLSHILNFGQWGMWLFYFVVITYIVVTTIPTYRVELYLAAEVGEGGYWLFKEFTYSSKARSSLGVSVWLCGSLYCE